MKVTENLIEPPKFRLTRAVLLPLAPTPTHNRVSCLPESPGNGKGPPEADINVGSRPRRNCSSRGSTQARPPPLHVLIGRLHSVCDTSPYRAQTCATATGVGPRVHAVPSFDGGDSSGRHCACPANQSLFNPIMRLAGKAPVADRWRQRHASFALMKMPFRWVEWSNDLQATAAAAKMRSRRVPARNIEHARRQLLRNELDEFGFEPNYSHQAAPSLTISPDAIE